MIVNGSYYDEQLPTNRVILRGVCGSRAYGTNTETSDWDYRGVMLPTRRQLLRGVQPKSVTRIKDNIDEVIWGFSKFMKLAATANPHALELLGLKEYDVVSPFGLEILENKDNFLSKRAINTFRGTVFSTQKRYKKMVEKFQAGDDTVPLGKCLCNIIRLWDMSIEVLDLGIIRPRRDKRLCFSVLRPLKEGKFVNKNTGMADGWIWECIEEYENQFNKAAEETELPDEPDWEWIWNMIEKVHKEIVVNDSFY